MHRLGIFTHPYMKRLICQTQTFHYLGLEQRVHHAHRRGINEHSLVSSNACKGLRFRASHYIWSQIRQMAAQSNPPFIVAFYDPSIQAEDGEGRTLDDILGFSDDQLEYYHDFVQYLFPLPERSPINPYAPTITEAVRTAFSTRADLQSELRRSLKRMLNFYGFTMDTEGSIIPGEYFEEDSKATWRKRMDHNHLRITRIIRCLRVLGLEEDAAAFHQALLENDKTDRVGSRTLQFWKRAAERGLHLSPQENDENAMGIEWLKEPQCQTPSTTQTCDETDLQNQAGEVNPKKEDTGSET